MSRPHQSAGRLHALAHARRVDADRLRVLENPRAVFFRVGREAERVIERMNLKCLREMNGLEIIRAAQHLAHLIGRPSLDVGAEIHAQHRGVFKQPRLVVGAPNRELAVSRLDTGHRGFADGAADIRHEALVEPNIMHGNEHRSKHLGREKKVADGAA